VQIEKPQGENHELLRRPLRWAALDLAVTVDSGVSSTALCVFNLQFAFCTFQFAIHQFAAFAFLCKHLGLDGPTTAR
jgi:hypothetical protein